MRRLVFHGPGHAGLGFVSLAFLIALPVAAALPAQQGPSVEVFRGPKCFNTVISEVVSTAAHIIGARMPGQELYSIGDELFVDIDEGPLEPGAEYLLYRVEGTIRHPDSGESVGDAINLLGRARVIEADGVRGLIELTTICGEIEAGDLLHRLVADDIADASEPPEFDPVRLLTPLPGDAMVVFGSAETVMIDARRGGGRGHMTERETYMLGEVVTIDQGRSSGWIPGTWGFFYNEGLPLGAADSVRSAGAVISAQGHVIWATDTTAAIVITAAEGAVMVKNRVRRLR